MTRHDPEVAVQVLDDDGVWRDAWAYYRQFIDREGVAQRAAALADHAHVLQFVRYPDQVHKREE